MEEKLCFIQGHRIGQSQSEREKMGFDQNKNVGTSAKGPVDAAEGPWTPNWANISDEAVGCSAMAPWTFGLLWHEHLGWPQLIPMRSINPSKILSCYSCSEDLLEGRRRPVWYLRGSAKMLWKYTVGNEYTLLCGNYKGGGIFIMVFKTFWI